MADDPRQPTGSDAEAIFDQRTHHELYSGKNEIVGGPGVRISRTTRGKIIRVRRPPPPSPVQSDGPVWL